MKEEKEYYEHPLYKYCDEKEADAIAWAFINEKKMVKFPFKFPEILPNEIRINMLYVGLCMSDVHTVRGLWGKKIYPIAPGHEIIGEVSLLGSEVKDFKKGELVGFGTKRACCEKCKNCLRGRENICFNIENTGTYGLYWGGYATAMQQPSNFFYHLPKNFDLAKGSPLFCAGITTFYPIEKFLSKDTKKTGVVGCGGLGHMAIQFLHKLGYHVTAFTTNDKKSELLKQLGANEIIISTDEIQMNKAKESIEFLINTIPKNIDLSKYVSCIENGGKFIQVGEPPINGGNLQIPISDFVDREIEIIGSNVGPRKHVQKMIELCAEKNIYPIVEEYQFEDLPKAFDKLENGNPFFRCVVNVKDFAEKNGFKK